MLICAYKGSNLQETIKKYDDSLEYQKKEYEIELKEKAELLIDSKKEIEELNKKVTDLNEEINQKIMSSGGEGGSISGTDGNDDYFVEAGRFIIEKQKASIGMLQRVYKIGFNRAARIMDQLTAAGVVGPEEGTKPRKILMTQTEFDEYLGRNL